MPGLTTPSGPDRIVRALDAALDELDALEAMAGGDEGVRGGDGGGAGVGGRDETGECDGEVLQE